MYVIHPKFVQDGDWAPIPPTSPLATHGVLLVMEGQAPAVSFAQNIWFDAAFETFSSIGEAAKFLRSKAKLWTYFPTACHRRASLIADQLKVLAVKPRVFPTADKLHAPAAFTLVDEHTLLYAPKTQSPFPHGKPHFVENKMDPPSRAYLKLWEALTLARELPTSSDVCLDLGASPGGWSWVLRQLGAEVVAIDRSPLAEGLMKDPKVRFIQGNAFSLTPGDLPEATWLVSDIICYPSKLLELVSLWISQRPDLKMICTIKLQAEMPAELIQSFSALPNTKILHLYHNKHELTWFYNLPMF